MLKMALPDTQNSGFKRPLSMTLNYVSYLEVAAVDTDVVSHCDPGQGSATEKEVNIALLWAD